MIGTAYDLEAFHHQVIGPRTEQQDYVRALDRVLIGVDGVGGRPGGMLAARTVARTLETLLPALALQGDVRAAELAAAFDTCRSQLIAGSSGVGAIGDRHAAVTAAFVVLADGLWWVSQVGDVRVTIFRAGLPILVTTDHNRLSEFHLARPYESPPDGADLARQITRMLSADSTPPPPTLYVTDAEPLDVALVTTDGIHDVIGHLGLSAEVYRQPPGRSTAESISRQVIAAATTAGLTDNASVAVGIARAAVRIAP